LAVSHTSVRRSSSAAMRRTVVLARFGPRGRPRRRGRPPESRFASSMPSVFPHRITADQPHANVPSFPTAENIWRELLTTLVVGATVEG
jgi:hypothetical protein